MSAAASSSVLGSGSRDLGSTPAVDDFINMVLGIYFKLPYQKVLLKEAPRRFTFIDLILTVATKSLLWEFHNETAQMIGQIPDEILKLRIPGEVSNNYEFIHMPRREKIKHAVSRKVVEFKTAWKQNVEQFCQLAFLPTLHSLKSIKQLSARINAGVVWNWPMESVMKNFLVDFCTKGEGLPSLNLRQPYVDVPFECNLESRKGRILLSFRTEETRISLSNRAWATRAMEAFQSCAVDVLREQNMHLHPMERIQSRHRSFEIKTTAPPPIPAQTRGAEAILINIDIHCTLSTAMLLTCISIMEQALTKIRELTNGARKHTPVRVDIQRDFPYMQTVEEAQNNVLRKLRRTAGDEDYFYALVNYLDETQTSPAEAAAALGLPPRAPLTVGKILARPYWKHIFSSLSAGKVGMKADVYDEPYEYTRDV